MTSGILRITDGTTTISLIDAKFKLDDGGWSPANPELENGGIWQDSSLSDGRRLVMAKFANVRDVFSSKLHGGCQDDLIQQMQELKRLGEKARSFWIAAYPSDPVWIEARGDRETNTRYALVYDISVPYDANPHEPPFSAGSMVAMDDLDIQVEHGIWTSYKPKTVADCVRISNQYGAPYIEFNEVKQSTDDAHVSGVAIQTALAYLMFGNDSLLSTSAGMRFQSVGSITTRWVILKAYIRYVQFDADANVNCNISISHQMSTPVNTFSTQADFAARTQSSTKVSWTVPAFTGAGTVGWTPDISTVVQSYIDNVAFGAPNPQNLVIFFDDNASSTYAFRRIASYDHATYDAPQLWIYTLEGGWSIYGMEPTCDDLSVFICNKHTQQNITHAIYYDASTGTYSTNLMLSSLPYDILPNPIATGDILYLGCDNLSPSPGIFTNAVFDLDTSIAINDEGRWEYWTGAAWTRLNTQDKTAMDTAIGLIFDYHSFSDDGIGSVWWRSPSDWATTTVNGVTGYWVRYRLTSVMSAAASVKQQNRQIYTVNTPYVDIEETEIGGDIPARANWLIRNTWSPFFAEGGNPTFHDTGRVIMGLRSDWRGEEYTPYLNMTDVPFYDDAGGNIYTVGAKAEYATFATSPYSTTGRYIQDTGGGGAVGAERDILTVTINPIYGNQWIGEYRVFVRYLETSPNIHYLRLQASTRNTVCGSTAFAPTRYDSDMALYPQPYVCELGRLSIMPPYREVPGRNFAIALNFDLISIMTGASTLYLYDIILMPADEWIGDFYMNKDNVYSSLAPQFDKRAYRSLMIDSIYGREAISAIVADETGISAGDSIYYKERWGDFCYGNAILAQNQAHRVWFFTYNNYRDYSTLMDDNYESSHFEMGHTLTVKKAQRYLGMRGAR